MDSDDLLSDSSFTCTPISQPNQGLPVYIILTRPLCARNRLGNSGRGQRANDRKGCRDCHGEDLGGKLAE